MADLYLDRNHEEEGHDSCSFWRKITFHYARNNGAVIPRVYARRVSDDLYTVWMNRHGVRIAHCNTACCAVRAKAEFVDTYLIVDEAEPELNRLFAL
jgi:hypothetical protein